MSLGLGAWQGQTCPEEARGCGRERVPGRARPPSPDPPSTASSRGPAFGPGAGGRGREPRGPAGAAGRVTSRDLPPCRGGGRGGSRGSGGRSGPAGARGGGWSAGLRSGRGRVEGWSLRRSQAGLYCSALRRPERAACAGDSARGSGLPRFPPPPAPGASQRAPRRLGPARRRPEGVASSGGVRVSRGAVGK